MSTPGSPSPEPTLKEKEENGSTITEVKNEVQDTTPMEDRYLHGLRLWLAYTGLLLCVFLVALDQSVVATAIPRIASQFHDLQNVSWIVSAFFLTDASLLMFFGWVLRLVSSKSLFLYSIIVFEAASLICALAPNMSVLIVGRALQGVGGAAGFIAFLTIVVEIASLKTRPILLGIFGAVFGLAGVIGPVVGGEFTDHVSWRWVFYINLPLGGLGFTFVAIFLPLYPPLGGTDKDGKTRLQRWLSLDWIGVILELGMTTSIILALQWGGITRAWNDRVIIALFALTGVLLILFGIWEYRRGASALLPPSMFLNRTQLAAGVSMFFIMATHISNIYHIPFFYQAKGRSAAQSGVDMFPYVLGMFVGNLSTGVIVRRLGRYWPFMITGPIIGMIGAGLLFTIDEHTSNAKLIGYQVLMGFGIGNAFQIPVIAVQAEFAHLPAYIAQATSLQLYMQLMGAVLGISITTTIFGNVLSSNLSSVSPPIDQSIIDEVKQSVTAIFAQRIETQAEIVHAYVKALGWGFFFGVPALGISLVAGLFVRNHHLKERGKEPVEEK